MIPNKVFITGFKRFKDTSVLLDRNLLAFVGANEAGKSSFLQALLSIENSEPYSKTQLTKGLNRESDDIVVKVEYILEIEELQKLKEFNSECTPRFYFVGKKVDGELFHGYSDEVYRDKNSRKKLIIQLSKFLSNIGLKKFVENNFYLIESEKSDTENSISLKELISNLEIELTNAEENISELIIEEIERIQSMLSGELKYHTKAVQKNTLILSEYLNQLLDIEQKEHPKDLFLEYCDQNRPNFVFFSEDDRYLQGAYTPEELENPPSSISNLFSVSGISIADVLETINDNDNSERLRLVDIANENLKNEYCISWSQSDVHPKLLFDPESIKIQILSSKTYTEIQSRSDGLKQYIALKAFLSLKGHQVPPILLIDEAEVHLHYSAQSDLVREFERQNVVNSIIYTTHSAGCLPSDLGTGIRVVEPIIQNNQDTGVSRLKNSVWTNDGGFSPILLAMGANIIAFTLARKAVIAEGPSETILLPRLLREANNLSYLDFQVAPGIASVSKKNAALFEFEAAKIVYLVDGDSGGNANRKKLISGGISENKIVQLKKGCSIEDYVNPDILNESINYEFHKSKKPILECQINKIPESNRINWLDKQCKSKQLELPNKKCIAENISQYQSDISVFDKNMKNELIKMFKTIQRILDT